MSRIGKAPIEIPAGVTVDVAKDNVVTVKGPKGTLSQAVNPEFTITIEDGHLHIARPTDDREHRAQHRANVVIGYIGSFVIYRIVCKRISVRADGADQRVHNSICGHLFKLLNLHG